MFEKFWDLLSNSERDIISNDVEHESQLFKWFTDTVNQNTQSRYENPDYFLNNFDTFKYPRHEEGYGSSVLN